MPEVEVFIRFSISILSLFVVSASPLLAAERPPFALPACQTQTGHASRPVIAAADVVDRHAGAHVRVEPVGTDGVRLDLAAGPLTVRKMAWSNGDIEVWIRYARDEFRMSRRGDRLQVARGGQAFDVDLTAPGTDDLARVRQVLTDSEAVRRFRALRSVLSRGFVKHAAGAGVAVLDGLLAVLSGEMPVAQPTMATFAAADETGLGEGDEIAGPSCWDAYVTETNAAWNDYVGCIGSFAWYNPMREVCAFVWVLRAESAWFQFLGCSSIPIKKEPADVPSSQPGH